MLENLVKEPTASRIEWMDVQVIEMEEEAPLAPIVGFEGWLPGRGAKRRAAPIEVEKPSKRTRKSAAPSIVEEPTASGFERMNAQVIELEEMRTIHNFRCEICVPERTFSSTRSLNQHVREAHGQQTFQCEICIPERTFSSQSGLNRYMREVHGLYF